MMDPMNERELTTLWLGATRYYLGRQTYAVADFTELLRLRWTELPASVHAILRLNVEQTFEADDQARKSDPERDTGCYPLGADMDRMSWGYVRLLWAGL